MPIPILQYGVKVRDPTTKEFSDLAALRGGQGPQGAAGPGVPAGGTDGDVLVKNGATDYDAKWTNTPPQMRSLATIETSPTTWGHAVDEYIVYNGQLYKVVKVISPKDPLDSGPNGNIAATNAGDELSNLNIAKDVTLTESQYWNYGKSASFAKRIGHLVSLQIFGRSADTQVPPSSGGVFTKIGHIDCLPMSMVSVMTHFDGADAQIKIDTNGDILYYNYSTTARMVLNAYICFFAY